MDRSADHAQKGVIMKKKKKLPKQRNWYAVAAHFRTGAGSHGKKKYSRKIKHKSKEKQCRYN